MESGETSMSFSATTSSVTSSDLQEITKLSADGGI